MLNPKNDMVLYLTTRGRADYDSQLTLRSLPSKWHKRVIVVCPKGEKVWFQDTWPGLRGVLTPPTKNLSEKRKWIFENSMYDKIMMLDDDIRFFVRERTLPALSGYGEHDEQKWQDEIYVDRDVARLRPAEPKDKSLDRMFKRVEDMLSVYAHGGISIRYMNQVWSREFRLNWRCLHALAYHVPTVRKHCKLGRVLLNSDYDYALQLMKAGYENAVYYWGAQEDPLGFNAPGGVSLYRDKAKIIQSAEQLVKLHPGFVSAVPYRPGSQYEHLGVRTLARWKKAVEYGLQKRGVTKGTISGK